MGPPRVLKFGGAALGDGAAVERVGSIVQAWGGDRPVLVVSAHGGVTAQLQQAFQAALEGHFVWDPVRIRHRTILRQLGLAGDSLDRLLVELRVVLRQMVAAPLEDRWRFRDHVLSFGERMSARVVALALGRRGLAATPVDAFDLGLRRGSPRGLTAPRSLGKAVSGITGIPVVTGFLALDEAGDLATLGPNGSDLTAVGIGSALGAECVQFWKEVDGLSSADPALVPEARSIRSCGWNFVRELTARGAVILHPACLEPAREAGLPLEIRCFTRPEAEGTRIGLPSVSMAGLRALAHRGRVTRISTALHGADELAARIESLPRSCEPLGMQVEREEAALYVEDPEGRLACSPARGAGLRFEAGWATLSIVGSGVGRDRAARAALLAGSRGARTRFFRSESGDDSITVALLAGCLMESARRLHRELLVMGTSEPSGAAG